MEPLVGQIILFAGGYAPRGWAFCNGQLLPIAQHKALFSLIGTIYGGDGITNFALPDLRGRVIVGTGQAPGLSQYARGATVGKESVTLTTAQLPQHRHELMGSTSIATRAAPNGASVVAATGSASDAVTVYDVPVAFAMAEQLLPAASQRSHASVYVVAPAPVHVPRSPFSVFPISASPEIDSSVVFTGAASD